MRKSFFLLAALALGGCAIDSPKQSNTPGNDAGVTPSRLLVDSAYGVVCYATYPYGGRTLSCVKAFTPDSALVRAGASR